MNYKPRFLPQVNAPYNVVLQKLDDENVEYNIIEVDPNNCKPLQGITFSDEVNNVNVNDENPIWLSRDDEILDGHHRFVRSLIDEIRLIAIKLDLNSRDACRILNKIQDIYEYEQSQGLEEVESQDAINFYDTDEDQFLNALEEDNNKIQLEIPNINQQSIVGYRKDPIRENSVNGNFFTINPIKGFDKYQIDFDNLFDAEGTGVSYKDSQNPVDILSKIWFPHVNFEKLCEKYNIPSNNLKYKAIAKKAKSMGFDGIKFNTIIWGLK